MAKRALRVGLLTLMACTNDPHDPKDVEQDSGAAALHDSSTARDSNLTPLADASVVDARVRDDASLGCLATSARPSGCGCSAKRECAFECAIPSRDERGVELRCEDVREARCSSILDPPGCHCVLGDDGGSASDLCWAGIL
jgi:hypothetical protein